MGIILPESLLSNDTTKDVLQDVQKTAIIKAVVSLPEIAFAMAGGRGTTAKTACLIVQKRTSEQPHENYEIFMAIIKDCGKNIGSFVSKKDETSLVSKNYIERTERSELGFYVNSTDIDNFMYIPEKYYKNTIPIIRQTLFTTNTFHKLKDLRDSKIIEIKTFGGIKSEDYVSDVSERAKRCERTSEANERSDVSERAKRCERTSEANERNDGGTIPFIRTSDIYEWEILTDTAIKIMDATYLKLPEAKRNHIAGDILFVKSSSVGSLAMITAQNTRIALQCEFYRIRVLNTQVFNHYLLFHCLNTEFIKAQIKHLTFKQVTFGRIQERFYELEIAIPNDINERRRRSELIENIINTKAKIREDIKREFY